MYTILYNIIRQDQFRIVWDAIAIINKKDRSRIISTRGDPQPLLLVLFVQVAATVCGVAPRNFKFKDATGVC